MSDQRSPADDLRCSLELLWRGGERPARGPKPSLTLDQIVDAAIRVADAEGLDALSMRRIAAELGVGTMSLYRYLPRKSVLITLMVDKISDPSDCIAEAKDAGWRERLEAAARSWYRLYLAHPWLLRADTGRPVFGPNSLARFEFVIAGLGGLGLTDQERVGVVAAVEGFATGYARQRLEHDAATEATGVSDEEFWAQQYPVLQKAMRSGAYPTLAALTRDAFSLGWDGGFEFGLARVLDGVAALVEARRAGAADAGPADPAGARD